MTSRASERSVDDAVSLFFDPAGELREARRAPPPLDLELDLEHAQALATAAGD